MLAKSNDTLPDDIKKALDYRLQFRISFLKAVESANFRTSTDVESSWRHLIYLIPYIRSSTSLGKPVPDAFSVKLQRKLVSTVPPRPIVQISLEAAFDHLENLCKDGIVAAEVLMYHDSHSLMVGKFGTSLSRF